MRSVTYRRALCELSGHLGVVGQLLDSVGPVQHACIGSWLGLRPRSPCASTGPSRALAGGWVGDVRYEGHVCECWGCAPRSLRDWGWWSRLMVVVLVIGRQLLDNWS